MQWHQWPAFNLVSLDAAAQIEDALQRGYRRVGSVQDEAGATPGVLLYKAVDQLRQCLDTIVNNPANRRILFHGWNWAQIEEMALPPSRATRRAGSATSWATPTSTRTTWTCCVARPAAAHDACGAAIPGSMRARGARPL